MSCSAQSLMIRVRVQLMTRCVIISTVKSLKACSLHNKNLTMLNLVLSYHFEYAINATRKICKTNAKASPIICACGVQFTIMVKCAPHGAVAVLAVWTR